MQDCFFVGTEIEQDAGGHTFTFPYQSEQNVLGTDVAIPEVERFAQSQLKHLLGSGCEGHMGRDGLISRTHELNHLVAELLDGDAKSRQNPCGHSFLLAQQSEREVLGADVFVPQLSGLILGQYDCLFGKCLESFEHFVLVSLQG